LYCKHIILTDYYRPTTAVLHAQLFPNAQLTPHREHPLYYMLNAHMNILYIINSILNSSFSLSLHLTDTTLYEMPTAHLNAVCYMLDACASSSSMHASQRTHVVTIATFLMSPSAYLTENTVTSVTTAMKCQSLTSSMLTIQHPTPFP